MTRPRLILASGSPRRRELLTAAGYRFEVAPPHVTEAATSGLTLHELTSWNALRKGLVVARANPRAVILAADTLVALDGEIIGKPANLNEAREIIARLSGREHKVATSVFVAHFASGRMLTFSARSRVFFRKRNAAQIERYLEQIDPLDKAGAYAAQGLGRAIVRRIVGSRTNVIGLPLDKVRPALALFGIRPGAH